jgi:hypothetical protein
MTFLAPGFFYASLAVAAAVVALHFIVTRLPRAGVLPTARFVPDLPANATARATRPSDLLLMLLRVLIVIAAGAGLAKPVVKPSRGAEARVILMDVSRSVSDTNALRDSVRALYRNHDALVVFDSSARVLPGSAADSVRSARFGQARGNLSAALIAAIRAGSGLRDRADSIELVVVSPFAAEELDAATDSIRGLWKGRARLVSVRTISTDTSSSGRALIQWPKRERPPFAVTRGKKDTIGGVLGGDVLVVSAFERQWSFPRDSIRGAEVVARWIDGEPAAVETPSASGCVRSIAVPVSAVGDLVIRRDFVRFVAALNDDCALRRAMRAADPQIVSRLAGTGRLASRESFRPRGDIRSDLAPWLLGLAIAAAIAELFVRRRRIANAISGRPALAEKRAA